MGEHVLSAPMLVRSQQCLHTLHAQPFTSRLDHLGSRTQTRAGTGRAAVGWHRCKGTASTSLAGTMHDRQRPIASLQGLSP